MAPSIAQLAPETPDAVEVAKENIKVQEVKVNNVRILFHLLFFKFLDFVLVMAQGPSYPFYYPYFDVNEKYPPLKLFSNLSFYFTSPDFHIFFIRPCRSWYSC